MDRLSLIATRQTRGRKREYLFAALIAVMTLFALISMVAR